MKLHVKYGAALFLVVAIWIGLKITMKDSPDPRHMWLIDVFPWLSLMAFGSYCLGRLGLDLLTFNDYPKEIKNLEQDIKAAREDLKKRGFKQ